MITGKGECTVTDRHTDCTMSDTDSSATISFPHLHSGGHRSGPGEAGPLTTSPIRQRCFRSGSAERQLRPLGYAEAWFHQVTDPETGRTGYANRGEPSARHPGDHYARFPPDRGEALTALAVLGGNAGRREAVHRAHPASAS